MVGEKNILKLMCYSRNTYYVWKREKRPIIDLLDKYFQDYEITEFLETGKITRFENSEECEILNEEFEKIYNSFVANLYIKESTLLKLFLSVVYNANVEEKNLNYNFIDLVFKTDGKENDKIELLKTYSKIGNNILFFISIKYMLQKEFEKIKFDNAPSKGIELSFMITYIQFFLEIFYKKKFLNWKEFEKNQIFHIIDDEWDFNTESNLFNNNKSDYIKFINRLEEYKTYLKSLITENDNLIINFSINQDENNFII